MKVIMLLCSLLLSPIAVAEDVKINIDMDHPSGVAEGRGSGFLHSLTGTEPPDRFVDPLKIKFWRGACFLDRPLYERLQRSGAIIQYVLSDGFQLSTQSSCWDQQETGRWPQYDPLQWRQHVEREAEKIKANGWTVIWEPWNEPDYWPGELSDRQKFQQFLDAFLIAYQAVKTVDPKAQFAGPSLSADTWPKAREHLEIFLQFCADHNIEVTNLTWHGFDDIKNTDKWPERIREIRALAADRFPTVKVHRVVISEIVAKRFFSSPGDLVMSLKYLDDAGADFAARACHTKESCWLPNLDGAVEKTRGGVFHPNPRWWANLWYASSVGPRYPGVSSDPGIVATAVQRKEDIAVLLGFSKAMGASKPQAVQLMFHNLPEHAWSAVAKHVPERRRGFLDKPLNVKNASIQRDGKRALLRLPSVHPGDVYFITLKRGANGETSPTTMPISR